MFACGVARYTTKKVDFLRSEVQRSHSIISPISHVILTTNRNVGKSLDTFRSSASQCTVTPCTAEPGPSCPVELCERLERRLQETTIGLNVLHGRLSASDTEMRQLCEVLLRNHMECFNAVSVVRDAVMCLQRDRGHRDFVTEKIAVDRILSPPPPDRRLFSPPPLIVTKARTKPVPKSLDPTALCSLDPFTGEPERLSICVASPLDSSRQSDHRSSISARPSNHHKAIVVDDWSPCSVSTDSSIEDRHDHVQGFVSPSPNFYHLTAQTLHGLSPDTFLTPRTVLRRRKIMMEASGRRQNL